MQISNEIQLDYDDILLLPNRSKSASRKTVDIEREFLFYHSPRKWKGTPIFAANMANTGTLAMSLELSKYKFCTALHKFYDLEVIIPHFNQNLNNKDYIWYTTGIRGEDFSKLENFLKEVSFQPNIVIDVPNGYTDDFVRICSTIRNMCHDSIIMAGNVCTSNMVQEIILHGGVDIVKCGNSFGGACRTKNKTGIGRPMFSTVLDCSNSAHGLKSNHKKMGLICADGGCKAVGDICKAIGGGADFIMLGSIFAGCDENEGDWEYEYKTIFDTWEPVPYQGDKTITRKKSLKFYGMSSHHAQLKHYNEIREYATSEGTTLSIPYKGGVQGVVQDILGGIRSCCSYSGVDEIENLHKAANFIRLR